MDTKVVKKAIKTVLDASPRDNCFKNNEPGDKWFKLFLQRHPEISLKRAEVLSKSRAAVTEQNIREWHADLRKYLESVNALDILDDPSRIYNMDESGIQLCPKTGKLLGETCERNSYSISAGQDKENITVLCSYSADGRNIRPMIIYPYKRMPPREVSSSVPDGYMIGWSDHGWMTTKTFNKFIMDGFYTQLDKEGIKFPVLLVFDGHASHTSIELHDFCVQHGILLYCLYPNATHIIQPCDVGIFKPLKTHWTSIVNDHSQLSNISINKSNFAPIFNSAYVKSCDPEVIKKAFERCGLFPFNADQINCSKCTSSRRKQIREEIDEERRLLHPDPLDDVVLIHRLENYIPEHVLATFRIAYERGELPSEEIVLYTMWKSFRDSQLKTPIDQVKNHQNREIMTIDNLHVDVIPPTTTQSNDPTLADEIDDLKLLPNQSNILQKSSLQADAELNGQFLVEECHDVFDLEVLSTNLRNEEIDTHYDPNDNSITSPFMEEAAELEVQNCLLDMPAETTEVEVPTIVTELADGNSDENNNKDNTFSDRVTVEETVQEIALASTPSALVDSTVLQHQDDGNSQFQSHIIGTQSVTNSVDNVNDQSYDSLNQLWNQALHYPSIIDSKKRKKSKGPQIFAITSEAWREQQEEKLKKEEEKNKMTEFNKYKRNVAKLMKEKETKLKKELKLKQQEELKMMMKEREEKISSLLKRKADTLNLTDVEGSIKTKKGSKRPALNNITNETPNEPTPE